jgi:SAM-dependent methyltransferase
MNNSTSAAFFDDKYLRNRDPWNFEKSNYEQARYHTILNELGDRIYARAFEPGCSVGVLTALLADRCNSIEATDISPRAVELARQRCRYLPHVNVTCGSLRITIPPGMFDLIVFSEIGYYFTEEELGRVVGLLAKKLEKDGAFLAVHWTGISEDHLLSGDRVHEILCAGRGLRLVHQNRYEAFRLDRFEGLKCV